MRSTVNTDIGSKQRSGSNSDEAGVQNDTVEIYKNAHANFYVKPIVYADWGFDPRFIFEEGLVSCRVGGWGWERGVVVDDAGEKTTESDRVNFFLCGI